MGFHGNNLSEAFISEWRETCRSSLLMSKGLAYAICISSDRKAGEMGEYCLWWYQRTFSLAQ